MLGSKISNGPKNNTFIVYLIHLKLRREVHLRWEKVKRGLDYRRVNKMMCSLEGDYSLFQRCVNLDA